MRKSILIWIAIILGIFFATHCYAAAGSATTYIVTIQSIQLKDDAGTWVTIATPNSNIDIAAVDAGAVAGSLLSSAAIPVGNYVNFKVVFSETMTVAGVDTLGNYTTAGGSAVLTGTATTSAGLPGTITVFTESAETWNNSSAGSMTIQVDLDGGDADNYIELYATADLTTPLVVTSTSSVSMWVDFDTAGTINYVNVNGFAAGIPTTQAMYFTPPGTGSQFSITVDDRTVNITAANMTMAF